LILVVTATNACGPSASVTNPSSATNPNPVAKKVLTLADSYEPKAITETFVEGHQTTGNNLKSIVQDNLLTSPQFQTYEPQLATELPSIEKGTWVVAADGTMDTTWRLRPNVKWHDGQPFTSADLVFTFQTAHDAD